MSEVPMGWEIASLGDVCEVIRGVTFPASSKEPLKNGTNVCCLRTANIQREIDWSDVYFISAKYVKRDNQLVQAGDILMSMANSYELVGKVAVVHAVPYETAFGAFLSAIRPTASVYGQYLFHLLRSNDIQRAVRTGSSQTTNIANISVGTLRTIPVPVAPLREQKRIANKLDRLLGGVDACRARLERVPGILKRFRRSVLAAATSGELTREWREERGRHSEGGSKIPSSWVERRTGEVGAVQLGRQRAPKFHAGDFMRPYLRVQNVFEDRIELSDVMEMDFPPEDFRRYELHYGDILLNEGQSLQFLGRPAMYRGELPGACFTNTLIRFQADSAQLRPEFALLVFRHHMHSGRYAAEGTITTNIGHLGAGRFADVEFPLPPLDEQAEIVRRAGVLFRAESDLSRRLDAATAVAERLAAATLAKGFRGELVAQDPNDESAAELLEKRNAPASATASKPSPTRSTRVSKRPLTTKIDEDSVRIAILKQKLERFSFDDLRAVLPGDYESLKSALFQLLDEPSPMVRQVFDKNAGTMLLERVTR